MPKITAATVAEHRERTYEALLDAVEELIGERGFDNVSMRDIAERAGVARTAIYNYAADRMTLLAASVRRSAASLHGAMAEAAQDPARSAPERLEAVIRLLLTSAHSAQNLLTLRAAHAELTKEQRHEAIGASRDDIGEHVRAIIEQGIAAGDYAPSADLQLTVELLAGVVDVAVGHVLEHPEEAGKITDSVILFVQQALGKRNLPATR